MSRQLQKVIEQAKRYKVQVIEASPHEPFHRTKTNASYLVLKHNNIIFRVYNKYGSAKWQYLIKWKGGNDRQHTHMTADANMVITVIRSL